MDALCRDAAGRTLAIEHTLIEPYARHKADTDRFLKTLAVLENDSHLVQPGYLINVSQAIGAIPTGIPWHEVSGVIALQLAPVLPGLPEGARTLTVQGGKWSLDLRVSKMATAVGDEGYFLTSRIFPGDPEEELMLVALGKKIPKLAAAKADKRSSCSKRMPSRQTWKSSFGSCRVREKSCLFCKVSMRSGRLIPRCYRASRSSSRIKSSQCWKIMRTFVPCIW